MSDILRNDDLFRRMFKQSWNKRTNEIFPSIFIQRDGTPDPAPSVYIVRLSDPRRVLKIGVPGQRLAIFPVSAVEDANLTLESKPEPDFPGHCEITGFTKDWKTEIGILADAASFFEVPE